MARFKAYIFDLDGTLLDTLPDLVALTNAVLSAHGLPEHSSDEILSYVGNGAASLMSQAVPEGTSDEELQLLLSEWKGQYATLGHRTTTPFPGMCEALAGLKAQGARLAVLSNKFDAAVKHVIPAHFPGVFDRMHGECEGFPRKPDPAGLLRTMEELGVTPEETAYVGDTAGDMTVARRAGAFALGVLWGYEPAADVRRGADAVVERPAQLLDF